MQIGIAGSGIAGLSAAWLLHRAGHRVTIFEKHSSLGMGAHSVELPSNSFPGQPSSFRIDVPPRMFNEKTWPNIFRLYREIGVETTKADQSKSFSISGSKPYLSLASSYRPQLSLDLLAKSTRQILADISRMMKEAPKDVSNLETAELTFDEYLQSKNYSQAFIDEFLYPSLSSTVCTCSYSAIKNYPAVVMLQTMIGVASDSGLYRTRFGTADVVNRLTEGIEEIRLETTVTKIRRNQDKIVAVSESSSSQPMEQVFDHFIVATQANAALRIDTEFSEEERSALSAFQYEDVTTLIHTDPRLMPPQQKDWASFNLISDPSKSRAMCSIWMNQFCDFETENPIFQTIMPTIDPEPAKILHTSKMQRPIVTADSVNGLEQLKEVHREPNRRLWFCGSYASSGVPLLESGLTSSIHVARRLGVEWDSPVGAN